MNYSDWTGPTAQGAAGLEVALAAALVVVTDKRQLAADRSAEAIERPVEKTDLRAEIFPSVVAVANSCK